MENEIGKMEKNKNKITEEMWDEIIRILPDTFDIVETNEDEDGDPVLDLVPSFSWALGYLLENIPVPRFDDVADVVIQQLGIQDAEVIKEFKDFMDFVETRLYEEELYQSYDEGDDFIEVDWEEELENWRSR